MSQNNHDEMMYTELYNYAYYSYYYVTTTTPGVLHLIITKLKLILCSIYYIAIVRHKGHLT